MKKLIFNVLFASILLLVASCENNNEPNNNSSSITNQKVSYNTKEFAEYGVIYGRECFSVKHGQEFAFNSSGKGKYKGYADFYNYPEIEIHSEIQEWDFTYITAEDIITITSKTATNQYKIIENKMYILDKSEWKECNYFVNKQLN